MFFCQRLEFRKVYRPAPFIPLLFIWPCDRERDSQGELGMGRKRWRRAAALSCNNIWYVTIQLLPSARVTKATGCQMCVIFRVIFQQLGTLCIPQTKFPESIIE